MSVSPPASSTRVAPRRGSRLWWEAQGVETRWYQCLLYPFRAWPLLVGLSGGSTLFSAVAALALPFLLRDLRAESSWLLWVCGILFTIPLLIFGYISGFLNCVLTSAMAGETRRIRWPGRDVGLALKNGASWLFCFLAGPVLPAGAGLFFWVYGGDFEVLDWIILAEANIVALAGWFLLVLAVNENDRLFHASPLRVTGMIQRFGHRLVALAVFVGGLGLFHGWLASVAVTQSHDDVLLGFFLLLLCWTSAIYWAAFLFRWAGLWFYWDRMRQEQQLTLVEGTGLPRGPLNARTED